MNRKLARAVTVLAIASYPSIAVAEQKENVEPAARVKATRPLVDASIDSPASSPDITFLFEATQETKTALARIGMFRGESFIDLKVSGPIADTSSDASLVTLDGLANSTKVDFGASWVNWDFDISALEMVRLCDEYKATLPEPDQEGFVCDTDYLIDNGHDDLAEKLYELVEITQDPTIVGLRAKLGRQTFNFLTPDTLEAAKESHTDWAVVAHAGLYRPRYGYLGANYEYQESHRAAESSASEICTPLEPAGSLRCRSSVIGAPTRRTASLLTGEWRYFVWNSQLAFNPRFAYEFKKDAFQIDLPVYFLQNSSGLGLNGGVTLRLLKEKDKASSFAIALFVGPSLNFIGG